MKINYMKILYILLVFLVLSSATCRQNQQPFNSNITCTVLNDVPYSSGTQFCGTLIQNQQDFDVYLPDVSPYGNMKPLVIYIHGGGFIGNNKTDILPYVKNNVKKILDEGIGFASINYRLLDLNNNCNVETCGVRDKCFDDIARCIKFIKANSVTYGIDKNRIGLIGTSAGATSAAWIGIGGFEQLYGISNNHFNFPALDGESTQVKAIFIDLPQYSLDMQSWLTVFNGQCNTTPLGIQQIKSILTTKRPCYLHAMYGVGNQSSVPLNQITGIQQYVETINIPLLMGTIPYSKPKVYIRNLKSSVLSLNSSSVNHHPLHALNLKIAAQTHLYNPYWNIPNICVQPTSNTNIDWWQFFNNNL